MKKILLIAASSIIMISCAKDSIVPETVTQAQANNATMADERDDWAQAVVEWTADPAVDGLGWIIRLRDNQVEVPRNLTEDYQKDGLAVDVAFKTTYERVPCRCAGPKYYIEIVDIRLRSR